MTDEQFPDIDVEDLVSLESILAACQKKGFEIIACALTQEDSDSLKNTLAPMSPSAQGISLETLVGREVIYPTSAFVMLDHDLHAQSVDPRIQEMMNKVACAPREQGQKLFLMSAPVGFGKAPPKMKMG